MTSFRDRHAKRLEEERKVNIYFVQMHNAEGQQHFFYVAASGLLHEQFALALEANVIPDFAVIVASGSGEPNEATKQDMKEKYGFDHAVYEQKLAESQAVIHDKNAS